MTRVLCIEDDSTLLTTLGANLRARGFIVDLAGTGREGLRRAEIEKPDVVILDLGLPDMSGIQVLRELRHWSSVPIVVLSARDTEFDIIGVLDAGADDYVTKPFGMGELLARIRASVRRSIPVDEEPVVETQDFRIDLPNRAVTSERGTIRLTPTEWNLVEYLVRNPDRLVTSRELLQAVWGPQYGTETQYLRVHMTHIRQKLEPDPSTPKYFRTEAGMGYRFTPHQSR